MWWVHSQRCWKIWVIFGTQHKVKIPMSRLHPMKTCGDVRVMLCIFLILILDGCEWLPLGCGRFTPGKGPPAPSGWEVGWNPEAVSTLCLSRQWNSGRYNFGECTYLLPPKSKNHYPGNFFVIFTFLPDRILGTLSKLRPLLHSQS
jgi:hypothetical protein